MNEIAKPTVGRADIIQFIRYAMVGVINTVITLAVIYVCKDFMGINQWVSNAIGYVAGFINSFVWNKLWVFRSHGAVVREALKFIGGFVVCYLLQLGATWILTDHSPLTGRSWSLGEIVISGYGVATLLGMVVYTLANFVYNKAITFAGGEAEE